MHDREREMEAAYALTILLNLLFLISNIHTTFAAPGTATSTASTKNYEYIKTACRRTTYSQVCYSSLSPYASKIEGNPLKLCTAALSVSIKAAKSASSTISNLSNQKARLTRREAAVIKDCIENTKDAIYELKESLDAMGHLRGSDLKFQIANIKTWVSAALTDENTCTDGFDGQRLSAAVKNKIRNAILNVARMTSNALSLINSIYS